MEKKSKKALTFSYILRKLWYELYDYYCGFVLLFKIRKKVLDTYRNCLVYSTMNKERKKMI